MRLSVGTICLFMINCFLAGCTSHPADMVGEPLNEAISQYGQPVGAVDFQGARAFFFDGNKDRQVKLQRTQDLMNPDMPISSTPKPQGCIYTFNALYTSAQKDWIIHSSNVSPECGGAN